MNYPLHEIIGNIGVFLIVGTYFLIQIGKMPTNGLSYSIYNGLGAAFILYSLYFEFNMSAFLVEFFWVIISLIGIIRYFRNSNNCSTEQES